jgi:methylmalonyl-CoA mutase
MPENDKRKPLFSEFPPVKTGDWEKKIHEDLRGADYEKKLVWTTPAGIRVKPYYRKEDLERLGHLQQLPGDYPYLRGSRVTDNDWFIRQDLYAGNLKAANEKALDILMKGITSLGFILDRKRKYLAKDLELLLKNIFAEAVEINFMCSPEQAVEIMKLHHSLLEKYNRDFQKVHGSIDYAPLSNLLATGDFPFDRESSFEKCKVMLETAQHLPHFSIIAVNGLRYRNAGSSIIQELGFSLAEGAEYLTQVTELGVSIDKVAPNIKFNLGIGPNYFMEIAKVRAARYLWAQIVKAYGLSNPEYARMNIHAVTADWNKTLYDPYVNMLRTTTESMSAIIAGIDSLTVRPFDSVFNEPHDLSERIARNQQLLLKEESYLDKVVDPGAGSYYIESMTDALIEEAWKLFLEVESRGGFIEAFRQRFIQDRVEQSAAKKLNDVALRKEILLGTNQYPNINEKLSKELDTAVFSVPEGEATGKIGKPLVEGRAGRQFAALRYKTDQYALKKKRPKVFLLPIGNLAMRLARSQFASNFFGCAGFDIIDNLGFKTIDDAVKMVHEKDPEIVVICSSDEEYPEIVPEVVNKLDNSTILVVAGYPRDSIEQLQKAGIRHFIHIRSNVLEILQGMQDELGIY